MGLVRILFLAETHPGFDLPLRPRVDRRRPGPGFFANFQRTIQPAFKQVLDFAIYGDDLLYPGKVSPQLVIMAQEALDEIFHMLMAENPSIEIDRLDSEGKILAFSASPGKGKRKRADLRPVQTLGSKPWHSDQGRYRMKQRRQFIKITFGFLAGAGILFSPLLKAVRIVYAAAQKIILPKDTDRRSLINRNPGDLDTRNLEPTPLKDFEVMGLSDHTVDTDTWRLEVTGRVKTPLQLTYSQLLALPAIERNVLLICPGVFANHGHWKGISIGKLLEEASLERGVTHVAFSGPQGSYTKVESFPIADIRSDRVFLAYAVNGETLPQKHGFALRVVAEGYYGSDWVKYVCKVEAIKS